MELIRIIKKSILCIICALAAVISICIYQVNSSNDAVVSIVVSLSLIVAKSE